MFPLLAILFALHAFAAEPAPDFTVNQIPNHQKVTLSQHKGQVVIVVFWEMWSAPSKMQLAALTTIYNAINDTNGDGTVNDDDKNKDGKLPLEIIAISTDDGRERPKLAGFLQNHQLPYTTAYDRDDNAVRNYLTNPKIPFNVVIDQAGNITRRKEGYHHGNECETLDHVASLLGRLDIPKPAPCPN